MIAVTTSELTRKFGEFTAVDRISIEIRVGEICGFLGPNGAGKSTLVRMLCGILEPTAGSGSVLGYDLRRQSEQIKQHIGYMSQKFSLYDDLTVKENLEFFAGLYSLPAAERDCRIAGLLAMVGLGGREHQLVSSLSGGWKQRLALGSAIISRPPVLFLDEPTSGVSPTGRREFFNIIQELANQGTMVIVTTHFMDEAERCHRIAFISGGRLIACDTPERLKTGALPGQLVELALPDPIGWIERIEVLPYVLNCSIHGAVLHVLLEDAGAAPLLEGATGGKATAITPSLGDLFIALAGEKRRELA